MTLPVIITLTTIPPRFHQTAKNIEHTLKNLKLENNQKFTVILNCPKFYYRFKENTSGRNELKKLKKYKNFIMNEDIKDEGPITKILPTISLINKPSIIIICDDEKYHINAFKKIIKQQHINFSTVYSYWVYNYPKDCYTHQIHVPQGVDMISVYSPFMNDFKYFYKTYENNKSCKLVDDLVLGFYFKQKGIHVKQLSRDWKWPWIPTQIGTPSLFNKTGEESRDNLMKFCYDKLG